MKKGKVKQSIKKPSLLCMLGFWNRTQNMLKRAKRKNEIVALNSRMQSVKSIFNNEKWKSKSE